MGFIFGGNTGMSYDDIQAKRKIAEQLLQQNASTPRNVGEGLSAIGRALAYRNITKKADAADATNKAAFDQQYSGLFAGSSGGSAPSFAPVDPNSPEGIGDATMVALGKAPDFAKLESTYGLPSGYLARTAQLESRGNPNAQNPNSSAGGMFQFIDSTAKQYGLTDKTDPIASADAAARLAADNKAYLTKALGREPSAGELYLAHQQGPAGAAKLILNQGAPAASLVGNDAVALNGGSGGMTGGDFAQKWLAKFGGEQPQSGSGMSIQALAEVAGSPYATPGQKAVAAALLQQQMDAADPAKQLQLEKERLEIDALKNPKEKPIEINGKLIDPKTFEVIKDYSTPEEGTTDQQNYRQYTEQETAAGRKPMSFGEFLVADEKAGVAGQPSIGTITPGYSAVQDPGNPSGYRMERIPGGPEDKSAADATKASNKETLTDVVVNAAARARSAAGNRALGGFGQGVVGAINPYSDSAEVQRQVDVLKSNATIESLNAMRAASPTGGALGAVSDSENKMLAAKAGALDPSSPNFARDLDDYELTLLKTVHGAEAGERIFKETRGDKPQIKPPATDADLPDGVTQEEWDAMTPEDRALWQN